MTQTSISERVGTVICADGSNGVAYRALRDLFCSGCGAIIKTSQLFTRWSLNTEDSSNAKDVYGTPRLVAKCAGCVPFHTSPNVDSCVEITDSIPPAACTAEVIPVRPRSELLEHMLLRSSDSDAARCVPSADTAEKGAGTIVESGRTSKASDAHSPADAVYHRLAPALHNRTSRARVVWRNKR